MPVEGDWGVWPVLSSVISSLPFTHKVLALISKDVLGDHLKLGSPG